MLCGFIYSGIYDFRVTLSWVCADIFCFSLLEIVPLSTTMCGTYVVIIWEYEYNADMDRYNTVLGRTWTCPWHNDRLRQDFEGNSSHTLFLLWSLRTEIMKEVRIM